MNGFAVVLLLSCCCRDAEAARYFVDMMVACEPMYRYAADFVDDTIRVSIKYLLIEIKRRSKSVEAFLVANGMSYLSTCQLL